MASTAKTAKKGLGIHFEIQPVKLGIRIKPRDAKSLKAIQSLGFSDGASLFRSTAKRILGLKGFVDPDQVTWPPLPDPFGILTGKQTLPWKLLNPAAEKCVICTCVADGGCTCVMGEC
jgi:hypothetical protein